MLNLKMPERFPPAIVMLIGFVLGYGTCYLVSVNSSAANEADQLDKDAKTALELSEEHSSIRLKRELNHVELKKKFENADCGNRTPANDILRGKTDTGEGESTDKTMRQVRETESGDGYIQKIRDGISSVFRQSE